MKSYNAFPDDFDYHQYLYSQDNRGLLPGTSIEDQTKARILDTVLAEEPGDGVYMEVGPSMSPYCVDSPRNFDRLYYVGVDGGKSTYVGARVQQFVGWGEKGNIFTDKTQELAQTMSGQPRMSRAGFLWADAQHLPFLGKEENTQLPVRETFMRDVLMKSVLHPHSVEHILREQARVLADDGTLIIRETDTMRYHPVDGTGRHPGFLSLIANLELTGFTKRLLLFDNEDAFPDLIRQFPGGDDDETYNTGYYLICQQGETRRSEPNWWQKLGARVGRTAARSATEM